MSDEYFEGSSERSDESQSPQQERPVFNIDGVTYAMESLPESVTLLINDLLRFNQEQGELQFRLRTIQAAQQTYVAVIKQELDAQGVIPLDTTLDSSDEQQAEAA